MVLLIKSRYIIVIFLWGKLKFQVFLENARYIWGLTVKALAEPINEQEEKKEPCELGRQV